MNKYKDWIVRFYACHKDIPKGHSDCETLKELVRCKDCIYAVDEYDDGECYCFNKKNHGVYVGADWNHFCSWAERKEE